LVFVDGMPSPTNAITAAGLVKHFGDLHALDGVSFEVPRGTVLGMLGPNGAGKTTAVRILTTTLVADAGSAVVAGFDVRADPQAVRRHIGLAGQYAAVDENLTGAENITLVGRLNHLTKPDARRRAGELLAQFQLSDAGNRPARTYSGGMRRRLDLAAALVTHPPVLLLDEPTTGLDPASRQDLWDVIGTLVADGTTVLLTTQYLEEADRLADNIVVIDHGVVVAEGSAAALKSRIGETNLVLRFTDATVAASAAQLLDPFGAHRAPADVATVSLPLRGGAKTVRDVLNRLDTAGLDVGRIDLHEPTLDDVFLALTGASA
jgi:ABC-2 type transport system ATP-binding protein